MTDKPKRVFVVTAPPTDHAESATDILKARTPREAAVACLNIEGFIHHDVVEVFEIGRGKRYARQATAVPLRRSPAGKAE